jgi:hypothetical protein
VCAYLETTAYEKALRKRKVWVEPLCAEARDWHGLRRFRLRRLSGGELRGPAGRGRAEPEAAAGQAGMGSAPPAERGRRGDSQSGNSVRPPHRGPDSPAAVGRTSSATRRISISNRTDIHDCLIAIGTPFFTTLARGTGGKETAPCHTGCTPDRSPMSRYIHDCHTARAASPTPGKRLCCRGKLLAQCHLHGRLGTRR